ncbi:TlpA family protein disulfide reductase [Chitinophaga sp. RAB17]|uniref:TlpA family protein disulfide reductase n=1 Tax=Chitinophaga sp. RAB17 TaxID=3233049 RepID=UPI003F8FC469
MPSILFKCLLLLAYLHPSIAEDKRFTVKIIIPATVNEKILVIDYDDGKDVIKVAPHFVNHEMTISGNYFSRYATIHIYPKEGEKFNGGSYWVANKTAFIRFSPAQKYPRLVNALDVKKSGEEKLQSFIGAAQKDKDDYWKMHAAAVMDLNSPERQVFFDKIKTVEDKKLQFLINNKSQYYSFWIFRTEIVYMGASVPPGYQHITVATLRKLYHSIFPDNLKNSPEGAAILAILAGREVRKNAMAPDFITTDIYQHKIALQDYRNKYVLLNFWASWCTPCVAELPAIKKIRDTYSTDQLEIISNTVHDDSTAFLATVAKYKISWIKVFNDEPLGKSFAATALPLLLLIDKSGKIIYERNEELTNEIDSLPLLQRLLKERLTEKGE